MRDGSSLAPGPTLWLVAAAFVGVSFSAMSAECRESAGALYAGVAKIDITPEKPVRLAGYSSRKELSQGVHDPLSARILVFKKEGKQLVVVSTDLIGFYGGTAASLRKTVLEEFALEPSELLLCAIHTHSGPSLTIDEEKGHANNLEYTKCLGGKLVEGIRTAVNNMGPPLRGRLKPLTW